jgi:hypothetical protein
LSHSTSPFSWRNSVSWTICLGWLWTAILLISASWVARVIGLNHWDLGVPVFLSSPGGKRGTVMREDSFAQGHYNDKRLTVEQDAPSWCPEQEWVSPWGLWIWLTEGSQKTNAITAMDEGSFHCSLKAFAVNVSSGRWVRGWGHVHPSSWSEESRWLPAEVQKVPISVLGRLKNPILSLST